MTLGPFNTLQNGWPFVANPNSFSTNLDLTDMIEFQINHPLLDDRFLHQKYVQERHSF